VVFQKLPLAGEARAARQASIREGEPAMPEAAANPEGVCYCDSRASSRTCAISSGCWRWYASNSCEHSWASEARSTAWSACSTSPAFSTSSRNRSETAQSHKRDRG